MEIRHSMRDGCLVVTFIGRIDLLNVSRIQRTLSKDLSQQPYALICDLSGVTDLDPVCASMFATVANHPSSRWPATSFLLCAAQPMVAEVLRRLRLADFLPLHATLEEAWTRPLTAPRTSDPADAEVLTRLTDRADQASAHRCQPSSRKQHGGSLLRRRGRPNVQGTRRDTARVSRAPGVLAGP